MIEYNVAERLPLYFHPGVEFMDRIWATIITELKKFFFDNKGKFYCMVVAVGAILVIFTFVLNFFQINKKAKIELVDASIYEDGDSPSIDIKVRNSGDSVAYLYCVKVYVLDSFQMREINYDTCEEMQSDIELTDKKNYEIKSGFADLIPIKPEADEALQNETELTDHDKQNQNGTGMEGPEEIYEIYDLEDLNDAPLASVDSSQNYLIRLSDEKEQEFNISQAVYPNDVDRFTLTLTDDEEQMEDPSVNCFYIEIYYNNKDYVSTSKMVIPLSADKMIYNKDISEINLENARENYEVLLKFYNYADTVRSEKFSLLLTSYEDNKNDFLN